MAGGGGGGGMPGVTTAVNASVVSECKHSRMICRPARSWMVVMQPGGRAAALESERTTDRLPVSCFICRCFSDQFIGFSSSSAKILRFELLKCEMFACFFPPLQ